MYTYIYLHSEFQHIYDRLGVTIIERGESYYQPMMPEVVKDLEEKGKSLFNYWWCNGKIYWFIIQCTSEYIHSQKTVYTCICMHRKSTHFVHIHRIMCINSVFVLYNLFHSLCHVNLATSDSLWNVELFSLLYSPICTQYLLYLWRHSILCSLLSTNIVYMYFVLYKNTLQVFFAIVVTSVLLCCVYCCWLLQ